MGPCACERRGVYSGHMKARIPLFKGVDVGINTYHYGIYVGWDVCIIIFCVTSVGSGGFDLTLETDFSVTQ